MSEKERLIKALNSYEYFENNKDILIDLFASYYGEEERANIENKFKNAIFIAILNMFTQGRSLVETLLIGPPKAFRLQR